ncbi:hypothetical protein SAY86_025503 [Trapa natans]|uniref:Fungal lipase-type domain-containing protein n=1 Tax=Trapa natans TaxID=22666 RepID=A0AAN7MXF8_TRANT|nr:hypothetical protein SAY86_025503 [Trapa natans]
MWGNMDVLCVKSVIQSMIQQKITMAGAVDGRTTVCPVSAAGRPFPDRSKVAAAPPQAQRTSSTTSSSFSLPSWRFPFRYSLKSMWFGCNGSESSARKGIAVDDAVVAENGEMPHARDGKEGEAGNLVGLEGQNRNWKFKIFQLRTEMKEKEHQEKESNDQVFGVLQKELVIDEETCSHKIAEPEADWCDACRVDFDEPDEEIEIDGDTFSRYLHKVSLEQANLYAIMAYLSNLAYSISEIKPADLLKDWGLQLVTSSVGKRGLAVKDAEDQIQTSAEELRPVKETVVDEKQKSDGYRISASTAYHAAISAASYVHSQMKGILSSRPSNESDQELNIERVEGVDTMNSEMVNFISAADSVTAVVAAEEEVKQALADDLKSKYSSPCEWFICDDDQSNTRFFVIQGSESMASWQANLLFEPIQFESFDTLVHRGIYEAAKGIYEQMLPEVRAHLKAHGDRATFRFTGHSLGGSLSLLINLMLLVRGEVPASSLLPVVTFGAPSVMCGGDGLLRKLGLPQNYVQAVTMNRDIVPRAFSCSYPGHVAELLKAINGNFRNHPCLKKEVSSELIDYF